MLGTKLMGYFIEWCETHNPRVAGVAYEDAVIRYDHGEENVHFIAERSPHLNLYVGINCKLLQAVDPVLDAAIQRVEDASVF